MVFSCQKTEPLEPVIESKKLTINNLVQDVDFNALMSFNVKIVIPLIDEFKKKDFANKNKTLFSLNYYSNKTTLNNEETQELIALLGFKSLESYQNYANQINNLRKKLNQRFPELSSLKEDEVKTIFVTASTNLYDSMQKGRCETTREKCENAAIASFVWDTTTCLLGYAVGGPVGLGLGLVCQSAASYKLYTTIDVCVDAYNNCRTGK
jgi:hypothetical protein